MSFSLIFRARCLDSRALSKLGVYIPKPELNSFFIRDEFDGKSVACVDVSKDIPNDVLMNINVPS